MLRIPFKFIVLWLFLSFCTAGIRHVSVKQRFHQIIVIQCFLLQILSLQIHFIRHLKAEKNSDRQIIVFCLIHRAERKDKKFCSRVLHLKPCFEPDRHRHRSLLFNQEAKLISSILKSLPNWEVRQTFTFLEILHCVKHSDSRSVIFSCHPAQISFCFSNTFIELSWGVTCQQWRNYDCFPSNHDVFLTSSM